MSDFDTLEKAHPSPQPSPSGRGSTVADAEARSPLPGGEGQGEGLRPATARYEIADRAAASAACAR